MNIIGQTISCFLEPNAPWQNDPPYQDLRSKYVTCGLDYRVDYDESGRSFSSWSEKYGLYQHHGDNFTSLIRNEKASQIKQNEAHSDADGNVSTRSDTMFRAEDMVLFSNGLCFSTCTSFSELMRHQGGVKTVVVGGRPQNAPMQAVGGVEGLEVWTWQHIRDLVNRSEGFLSSQFSGSRGFTAYSDLPFRRGGAGVVNIRDNIRVGDDQEVPLQFQYEAADCRIWYEASHIINVEALWERAADVAWRGQPCAWGTMNKTS